MLSIRGEGVVKCAGTGGDVYNTTDMPAAAAAAAWQRRMRELQGAVILASLGEVLLGMTGLVGLLVRYIGPLTIAPVITMISLPMVDVSADYARHNWWIALLYVDALGTVKNIRISADILWRVFRIFNGTGSVYVCIRKSQEQ